MSLDLEKLGKLAAEATPGPWANQRQRPLAIVPADQAGLMWGGSSDPDEDRQRFAHPLAVVQLDDLTLRDAPEIAEMFPHRRVHSVIAAADAAYIAAASPDVVAALVRVALAAKAGLSWMAGVCVPDGAEYAAEGHLWNLSSSELARGEAIRDALRGALAELGR